jgi:hypothetical protein
VRDWDTYSATGTVAENAEPNFRRMKRLAHKNGKKPIVVKFNYLKDTPGTYRFEEEDPEGLVRTLYIRKDAYPDGAPKKLEVTIKVIA